MAKRLSDKQKEEIIKKFKAGNNLDNLSKEFQCTKLTISRNLKKHLGEELFKSLTEKYDINKKTIAKKDFTNAFVDNNLENKYSSSEEVHKKDNRYEDSFYSSSFIELAPLNEEIDNEPQKDLSSIPLSEIDFPKIVYMIVDNKIELETKYLKDYPEWQFLPSNDLNRKTIQIFFDFKTAKRLCNKDHKVIKVPNTEVFKIVASILISRGITRIVTEDKLIAL